MKIQLSKRIRRFVLSCLIAGTASYIPATGLATDIDSDANMGVYAILDSQTLSGFDQWCEWESYNAHRLENPTQTLPSQSEVSVKDETPNDETPFVSDSELKDESASEELVSDELASDELASDELASDELASDELASDELVSEELVSEELVSEELVSEELVSEELVSDELASDDLASDDLEVDRIEEGVCEEEGLASVVDEALAEEASEEEWIDPYGDFYDTWYAEAVSEETAEIHETEMVDSSEAEVASVEVAQEVTGEGEPVSSALFAIAETICRRVGVSVQQVTEPFAMVTPYAKSTLEEIAELQGQLAAADDDAGSDAVVTVVESEMPQGDSVPVESIREELDSLATAEKPENVIDHSPHGQSVLVIEPIDTVTGPERPSSDALVGSSAVIATIEDAYWPYDLAASDIQIWNFFATDSRPYCIVDRNNQVEMWKEAPDLDESLIVAEVESVVVAEAVETIAEKPSQESDLNEMVCKLQAISTKLSPIVNDVANQLTGQTVGMELGRFLSQSLNSTDQAVVVISKQIASPEPVADVSDGEFESNAEEAAVEQIAEVPSETEIK
ncbi:hypothetical protein CA13_12450 [Planctomycetes bacterium CA13]|uniref:Uncharacterized protein n=1 Tax=Novipirellula herctigrandis TaxID=2527986 RepID=A0A5C5YXN8_9BACT|nr:hypothetical protein CA13_12450 [Planctomycetes bacterium CA13]